MELVVPGGAFHLAQRTQARAHDDVAEPGDHHDGGRADDEEQHRELADGVVHVTQPLRDHQGS